MRQAKDRLKDAKGALRSGNHPYAVRLSQECVELSIKAALRAIGIEYPKRHEVSETLGEMKSRLPGWFVTEVPFIQETSRSLFRKRELAFYGGEDASLSPEEVISASDARLAVSSARKVFSACERLLEELTEHASGEKR
ncbi:MAG TPA: HEPN domain-containing protein [Nitrososphaerales archaeon]|nr:HEPN domain-containing protein [Nitrososphaerales archaeon]